MAYATQAAKDKAVASAKANVERLTAQKEKYTRLLAEATNNLRVAEAEVTHRGSAVVVSVD